MDVIGEQVWFDSAVKRIPLVRRGEPVTKTYCVFWKKDNSGYYIEGVCGDAERVSLRESVFLCCLHTKQTYLKTASHYNSAMQVFILPAPLIQGNKTLYRIHVARNATV